MIMQLSSHFSKRLSARVNKADDDSHEQARLSIFRDIETEDNEKRLHSSLGWIRPNQYEALKN